MHDAFDWCVLQRETDANLKFLTRKFCFGVSFGTDFDEIGKIEILFFWMYRNFEKHEMPRFHKIHVRSFCQKLKMKSGGRKYSILVNFDVSGPKKAFW